MQDFLRLVQENYEANREVYEMYYASTKLSIEADIRQELEQLSPGAEVNEEALQAIVKKRLLEHSDRDIRDAARDEENAKKRKQLNAISYTVEFDLYQYDEWKTTEDGTEYMIDHVETDYEGNPESVTIRFKNN